MNQRKLLHYFLPIAAALFLIMAFPRFNQWYLGWIALIPLLFFIVDSPPRKAFWGGLLFGVIFQFSINYFVNETLFQFLSPSLSILVFLLLILYLSLFYGLYSYLLSRLKKTFSPFVFIFVISFLWVLLEYVRSLGLLGYTAGFLGYSQWNVPFLLRLASVYGYWGLPFLMVTWQTIIVFRIKNIITHLQFTKALIVWFLLMGVGLTLPVLFPVTENTETRNIALIQANIPQDDILSGSPDNLTRYKELTRKAVNQQENTDLVVWAETVLSTSIAGGKPIVPEVEELSAELQIPFLYGAITNRNDSRYNSLVLFLPETEELQIYDKNILVPVVEHFPFSDTLNRWLNLRVLLGSYERGDEVKVLDFNGQPVAGVICFESFFGSYTRQFAAAGAQHLFVLTNDGWLGDTAGIDQHAHMVMVRAAEMGIGVTQVANTGITVSADYTGKELLRSGINEPEILHLTTDFSRRKTIYQLAGDYFIYGGSLFFLFLILSARRRK